MTLSTAMALHSPDSLPQPVLLIGESAAGKTHFGAQLLLRLRQVGGRFAMRPGEAATNLGPFEETLAALHSGRSARHTAPVAYDDSEWPIQDTAGRAVDLIWPDYGGEQIRRIVDDRRVPSAWRDRIRDARSWLLLIRIQHAHTDDDIFGRPPSLIAPGEANVAFRASAQSRLVELLQIMMFIHGADPAVPRVEPRLSILLSCWDELDLPNGMTPASVLTERMPLLAAFARSCWHPDGVKILGLSALGKPLVPDRDDPEYVEGGPESHGFVVLPDGTCTPDLTVPLALTMHPAAPKK